ncbi:MAG: hypothetical protein P4L10_15800 [Acidobacteriaceae bacterium]|nr:hypothetical protein [Acidobacteriaceae bacterium]
MANTRFCAFNKSRGIILSLDVAVVDAAMDPLRVLRVLMEGLSSEDTTGLWITHFRAVPVARAVSPFDLIYLDSSHCVVHAIALTVDSGFEPFDGEPASALVLPPSIIASSQTSRGDQLVIVAAPETAAAPESAWEMPSAAERPHTPVLTSPVPHPKLPPHEIPSFAALEHSLERPAPIPAQPGTGASLPTSIEPLLASALAPVVPRPQPAPAPPPVSAYPAVPAEPPTPSLLETVKRVPAVADPPMVEYYREPLPSFRTRVLRWLKLEPPAEPDPPNRQRDRRRAYRLHRPDLVAYFFTGGAPRPHRIHDISVTGFFMQSEDLWAPGTVIRMTLQRMGTRGDQPGDAITVHSRMVRRGVGGGAFEFVLSGFLDEPYRRAAS